MSAEATYVRLTKLREFSGITSTTQIDITDGCCGEGSANHRIDVGYVVDGWFLEAPCIGRPMIFLRFCRNGVLRLGLFTSSAVISIGDSEIQTKHSVYRLQGRSFDQRPLLEA
jgi:hypothetical protein